MQNQNRFFDDLAKLMTNAAGAAQGAAQEIETLIQSRLERVVANMDLVTRDEFEAVKEMAANARAENEDLKAEVAALKAQLSGSGTADS